MAGRGFETALWKAWRQTEHDMACRLLERAFGFIAVELGSEWMPQELLGCSPVRHRYRVSTDADSAADAGMDPDALGIGSASVDVVLLPHTLEFCRSPQAVLREVQRVLAGEGHVLITGFNPWSAWAAARYLQRGPSRRARPLSPGRLCDWLDLLGFETVSVEGFFRRPPLNLARGLEILEPMERWRWVLPGCGYAILARKHVYAMTPLRLRAWEEERVGGFARPAMRIRH